jgi:hypothetical protein
MAQVGQVAISSDIPSALKDFYTTKETGLIPRAVSEIYPEGLTGAEAYAQRFQPLIDQGLVGAGHCRPDVAVSTGDWYSACWDDNARSVCFG